MAIIYSYPLNDNIKSLDELVGTTQQTINGQLKTVTRNFLLADIAEFLIIDGGIQKTLTLTTNGTSGVSTLDQLTGILNIPHYPGELKVASLFKETFEYVGSNSFTLINAVNNVLQVIVNTTSLHPVAYSVELPNIVNVLNELYSSDTITIIYNYLEEVVETPNLQSVTDEGSVTTNSITADAFIKSGGISTEYLMADGSINSDILVKKTGDTMLGDLILNEDPSTALGAATKQYVDNIASGINFHEPVHAATTLNLVADYDNGISGVGATLTATSYGALVVDTHTVTSLQRVLVWQQTDPTENGIYDLTVVGDGGTYWELTRSSDADNSPPGEIMYGDFTFVQQGDTYGGFGFICNTAGTITIGVTPINYVQFNAAQAVTAGYGLQELSPNVISINPAQTQEKITLTTTGSGAATLVSNTLNIPTLPQATASVSGYLSSTDWTTFNGKANVNDPTFTGSVVVPNATLSTQAVNKGQLDAASSLGALVTLDEGNGIGYVINGRTAANYGNVGNFAFDLSTSTVASSTNGATGYYAFAVNINNISSGRASFATGEGNTASNLRSFVTGESNNVSGREASAFGTNQTVSGNQAMVIGGYNTADAALCFVQGLGNATPSYEEVIFGQWSTSITPSSLTAFVSTDRALTVGNGTGSGARSNSFVLLKNGLATLPSVTNALIEADTTGKAVVTKEYMGTFAPLASPTFTGTVTLPNTYMSSTSKIRWGDDYHRIQYMGGNIMEIQEFGTLRLIAPNIELNGTTNFNGVVNATQVNAQSQTGNYIINGGQQQGNGVGQVSALARFYNPATNSGFYLSTDANLRESGIATSGDNFNIITPIGKSIKFRRSTGDTYYGLNYTANESTAIAEFDSSNNFSSVGTITGAGLISTSVVRLKNYTVATLPTGVQGDTAYVTDAMLPTYLGVVMGGGAVVCKVFYNGTNWIT